jgi:hypothetical protein
MPALVNEINNSKAHKILESWLANHKAFSGEQLQDVANKLNELDQPIKYSAISFWFANDLNQAKLMPVNWAIKLKDCYPDFPLEEYLRAYMVFYEEHKPCDQQLSSAHAFFEAYGDIVGYGYLAQEYQEYFSIFNGVENVFNQALPKKLSDDQINILQRALETIMLKESESENTVVENSKISEMLSKITSSINKIITLK